MSAGGQQSSSSSTGASDAFNFALSDSFSNTLSQGFNQSNQDASSFGQSTGTGGSQSGTFVDPRQQAFLDQNRQRAMGASQGGQGAATRASALNRGPLNQAIQSAGALGDPSAQIAAQTASLQSGLGDLFTNEINPAIEGNSLGSGGFGGGRQGVAQGVASSGISNAFAQGLGDITARANAQALQANQSMPGLLDARFGNEVAPSQFALNNQGILSGILGGPTVLSRGTSFSDSASDTGSVSSGSSLGRQGSVGQSGSTSRAGGQSRTRQKSQSNAWGFDVGFGGLFGG